MDQTSSAGRRTVIDTHPAVVAGGITICTRSPLGRAADNRGQVSSILCRLQFATSLASLLHQSKSAAGTLSRRQPAAVSTNTSPGRLMQSSVTVASARKGRSGRSVSSNAGISTSGAELINSPEVDITCYEHLDPVAVALGDRGWNVERTLEHFGDDPFRTRRIEDHGRASP